MRILNPGSTRKSCIMAFRVSTSHPLNDVLVPLPFREPDPRHERRQYEDIESRLDAEVMQNGISGLDARRLKRSAPHFRFAVDDADRELKLLLKDLCEDSLHGPVTGENNGLLSPRADPMQRRNHSAQL